MIVCMNCQLFFHPKKNGITIEEGRPLSNERDGPWGPYKLWRADLLECRGCGAQIAAGFALRPMAEHYMAKYPSVLEENPPLARVNDCP